jgi:hypothetical protein
MPACLLVRMAAVAVLAVLAACGSDDGAGVRDLGGSASSGSGSASASGTHTGSATGAHTGSATGTGSATATGIACEPVGDPSTAEDRLEVSLREWAVEPAKKTVAAGPVQMVAFNEGDDAHELVVVKGDDPASLPQGEDGTVDEEALPDGAFIGEIEAFPAGTSCNGVFDLEPGRYVLFCNILETEEGEAENHFEKGMSTTIRAR